MNMKTDTRALLSECLIMEINEAVFVLMCALVHVSGILIFIHTIKIECRKHERAAGPTWTQEEENRAFLKPCHQQEKRPPMVHLVCKDFFHIQFSKGSYA